MGYRFTNGDYLEFGAFMRIYPAQYGNIAFVANKQVKKSTTIFVPAAESIARFNTIKLRFSALGFSNFIHLEAGRRYTLDNGNYILSDGSIGPGSLKLYNKDDVSMGFSFDCVPAGLGTTAGMICIDQSDPDAWIVGSMGWNVPTLDTDDYGVACTEDHVESYRQVITAVIKAWLRGATPEDPEDPQEDPEDPGSVDPGELAELIGSDSVDFPGSDSFSPFPTGNNGFVHMWTPTEAQLQNIETLCEDIIVQISGVNPLETIICLKKYPFDIPPGSTKACYLAYGLQATWATVNECNNQYIDLDLGSYDVPDVEAFWGYAPYVKASIYLPFVGIHSLHADAIMGKRLTVRYRVSLLDGSLMAYVQASHGTNHQTLWQFLGHIGIDLPIASIDYSTMITGAMNTIGQIGTMIATQGATAPSMVGSMASNVMNSKPAVEYSGSLSANVEHFGYKQAILILEVPNVPTVNGNYNINYRSFKGIPLYKKHKLSDLKTQFPGYTMIEEAHVENIPATGTEQQEIYDLLTGGVLL